MSNDNETNLTTEQLIERFGFNPENVGIRPRGYWVDGESGELVVSTRDPGGGVFDTEAMGYPNFTNFEIESTDPTYCYYYFSPIVEPDYQI